MKLTKVVQATIAVVLAAAAAVPAQADDEPRRTRITLGPQVYPSYPGSDKFDVGPLVDVSRAKVGEPFPFDAPDQSFGIAVVKRNGFEIGPVVNWEGTRTAKDVGALLPKVKFSIEPGVFASYSFGDSFRLRGELRKGVTGHHGWIGTAGADYIARDGDAWLFSIGPRVTWSDRRYQQTWFGVAPIDAVRSGLPAFRPGGGVQAYGAAASFLTQITPRWGLYSYAKYDRLTGDPARSPIVRRLGSRDQLSGGVGLSYTFGGKAD
jgi:outer membrane scaffolding protein for murein synthesis (MipA/OmpV family)